MDRLFFSPKRYSLGRVGRFMLNRKLSMNSPLDKQILDCATLVKVIKKLISAPKTVNQSGSRPRSSCQHKLKVISEADTTFKIEIDIRSQVQNRDNFSKNTDRYIGKYIV